MSNIHQLPIADEAVVEQAAAWTTKLSRGLSDNEKQELRVWLQANKAHHRELLEMAKLWDKTDGLSRLAEIFPEPVAPEEKIARPPRQAWKVAAMLAVTVGAGWIGWDQIRGGQEGSDVEIAAIAKVPEKYETAIGEQSVFDLSDGTRLVLNTNSSVLVNFTPGNRLLTLERGEIHVTVAHDPRALSVLVGDRVVQAVGTEFNLEITGDQNVELVVTEGIVMIGVLDAPIGEMPLDQPVLLQSLSTLVASGQEVKIGPVDPLDEPIALEKKEIKAEEIAVRLSWRNGNLIFRGESLEDAVSEVGRYTAVEFVFLDEDAKKKRLSGMFKAGDVDGLLAALRKNFNISYEWVGDDKILLSATE